jgi:hypothetical protein
LANLRFEFQKRSQYLVGVHNVTPPAVAVRASAIQTARPVGIDGRDAASTPSGFAEIVSDDFPILHAHDVRQFIESVGEARARKVSSKRRKRHTRNKEPPRGEA